MKLLILLSIILFTFTGCEKFQQLNFTTQQSNIIYGTYSTKLTDKTPDRINNIKLGIEKLNGTAIKPKEEFSFNSQLGPRTKEAGYKEAIIFDGHGNKIKGYGGGICQISSTLYNAILNAGLEITERHQHSRSVPYIENGKDATVSYGAEDLKFVNTTNKPVVINATIENDILTITISQQ